MYCIISSEVSRLKSNFTATKKQINQSILHQNSIYRVATCSKNNDGYQNTVYGDCFVVVGIDLIIQNSVLLFLYLQNQV
jgi:hypothetical protein